MLGTTKTGNKAAGLLAEFPDLSGLDPKNALNFVQGLTASQAILNQQRADLDATYNRVNQATPYGGLNYTQNPDGTYTATTSLSPNAQKLLDQKQGMESGLNKWAQRLTGKAQGLLASFPEFKKLPPMPKTDDKARRGMEDRMYDLYARKLNTRYGQEQEGIMQDLENRKIAPGNALFNKSMDSFEERKAQGYNDAMLKAITTSGQESDRSYNQQMGARNQAIKELLQKRNIPLSEISQILGMSAAVGTGQAPKFAQVPNVAVEGTDIINPAMQYINMQQDAELATAQMENAKSIAGMQMDAQIQAAQMAAENAYNIASMNNHADTDRSMFNYIMQIPTDQRTPEQNNWVRQFASGAGYKFLS